MLGFLSKMFGGSKSEKDIKSIEPVVALVNQHFNSYQSISNDELRNKTVIFKERITKYLEPIDQQIADISRQAEELPASDISEKDALYQEVDKLKKERDTKIEEVLKEILPEAFAVVKETARRFKENSELVSTATQLDRDLSVKKDYIRIEDDKAIYKNNWTAAGGQITWNMLHYDV